jgi:enoyl-CoA hydratase/carnithine racemase
MDEVTIESDAHVAVVEMHRPPANFFDEALLTALADAVAEVEKDAEVRSIVLCSEGKHFCAGADLRGMGADGIRRVYRQAFRLHLYAYAQRLFEQPLPIVAAVQGAAVGGGLGLAMAADFRVAAPSARLTANFARLGFHQGFGLSVTLPKAVGQQHALDLLYTGRDVSGEEAARLGLCDQVSPDPRTAAIEFARRLAESAPLSVAAIRATMRRDLAAQVRAALDVEAEAQSALLDTIDFREGLDAAVNRRAPVFVGA